MKILKQYRWRMILLVMAITIINYLDRTALGVAAPTIMQETGITKEQYSWVVSAFQLAYTIGQPIMGWFIDFIGLKIGFAICAMVWGLATMAHALTGTWQGLAGVRAIMGSVKLLQFLQALKQPQFGSLPKNVESQRVYSTWEHLLAQCSRHR